MRIAGHGVSDGMIGRRLRAAIPGLATSGVLLAFWEFAVQSGMVSRIILPAPTRVVEEFFRRFDLLMVHMAVTMGEAVCGLFLGIGFALIVSLLISESPLIRRAIYPLILAKQVVPTVVFAPIILVWFGYGATSKIVISAAICFFPVVVNTVHGLNAVLPEILDLARSLGSSRWRILWRLRLPNAYPHIFTALKPTTGLAMIGAVVGEFIGGNAGLGYAIVESLRFLNLPAMFAATICLVIAGFLMFAAVDLLGLLTLQWYRKMLRLQGAG